MISYFKKIFASFRLLRTAFGPYRRRIATMAVFSFLGGILEGIGINAIIPLFAVVGNGRGATDTISRAIAEGFAYLHLPLSVKFLLAFMIVLFVVKTALTLSAQYLTARTVALFERETRQTLLRRTFNASWSFLSTQKLGHLDQMMTTYVANSSGALNYCGSALISFATLVVYGIVVLNISPAIALFALVAGSSLFLFFRPLLAKTRTVSARLALAFKRVAHYANEHIIGAKVLKSMNREEAALARGAVVFDEMKRLTLILALLKNGTVTVLQLMGMLFIFALFAFLYKTASFEFASFAVAVYALSKVFTGIQFVQVNLHAVVMQLPYLEDIVEYKEEALRNEERDNGGLPFLFEKTFALQNVGFSYKKGSKAAVREISFSVKKGEIVGLIGPSGSGKTTLADLILRLTDPREGRILLDDIQSTKIALCEWRTNVGYVPQEVFLLNGTIEDNIRFYDASLTEKDLIAAARAANIYDFIQNQPKGFRTEVGERGLSLSGGQRQRIALARALARRPQILILDEATSALDRESEASILGAIEALRGETTAIIIAHRLATIAIADTLVVLEKGSVIETGSPKELLKDKKSYFSQAYHLRS